MRLQRSEWCGRVARAISDGRYQESPGLYADHLAACPGCRDKVEGLTHLLDLLSTAREQAPDDELDLQRADAVVRAAVLGDHAYRRGVKLRLGICVLALFAGGVLLLRNALSSGEHLSSIELATDLHDRVFPTGAPPRLELLKEDRTQREVYLAALRHPSSLVRRTALGALTFSGVALPRDVLESVLLHAHEDLAEPLEVASTSGDSRALEDALETRRIATLTAVLAAIAVESSRGEPAVPAAQLVPYLAHGRPEVRQQALYALSLDRGYIPGNELWRLVRSDPVLEVRERAAELVLDRGGEEAAQTLVEFLLKSQDWELEQALTPKVPAHLSTRSLSAQRIQDPTTPTLVALAYAMARLHGGHLSAPVEVIARALGGSDARGWAAVAALASEGNWTQYRPVLQEKWRLATGTTREDIALCLTAWDVLEAVEARHLLALEICEAHRGLPPLRGAVERLAESKHPSVSARAQVLLGTWPKK